MRPPLHCSPDIMVQYREENLESTGEVDTSYVMIDLDELYEVVDWEEFCMTDSDQEDSPVKDDHQERGIESSNTEEEDDEHFFDLFELQVDKLQFRTIAHQEEGTEVFEFPAHIMRKEEMQIEDVVRDHVLPFLPAKSLIRFRTVSKDWDQWIASPFLAHKQSYLFRQVSGFFRQYTDGVRTFTALNPQAGGIPSPSLDFLPEPVVIRSSSNGLLLCQGRCNGENIYYVCNPVNQEWKALPPPEYYHMPETSAAVLAFDPAELNFAAHFEVICAFHLPDVPVVYFEIYSSETRSWRYSAANCIELGDSALLKGGFYAGRMVYWETLSGKVLAFDMKTEICGVLSLPWPGIGADNGVLGQMHGELCYVKAHNDGGKVCIIDVYGGMEMALKCKFTLNLEDVESGYEEECRVLPWVSDEIVMVLVGRVAYSYHLMDRKVEVISREEDVWARYLPYVNSLVSMAP
ncbi:hypothetical protein U1Q18_011716 [Sarracenia purpurea var. burkii]